MGHYWLNVAIIRLIIPAIFTACVIWRPTGLSLIYLILMLCSPFASIPTAETLNKNGHYLKACLVLTLLTALTQVIFHIVLASSSEIRSELSQNFSTLETIFRHIGLVRMNEASVFEVFYWLLPEIINPPLMIAMYFLSRRLTSDSAKIDLESTTSTQDQLRKQKRSEGRNVKIINFLGKIGTYIVLASLCCVASMNPSIEAGFYFIVFLGAATWWACNRELQRGFAVVCRIVMIVVVGHILLLMSYQNEWPQEKIEVNSTWYKYLDLKAIYSTNKTDPRNVIFEGDESKLILDYSYALRLFWLYFVLALQSQFLFKKPLMRFGSGRAGLLQDSTGSVTVQNGQDEDGIQMQSVSESVQENNPGIVEQGIIAIYSIFQLITNSSYLATNIIMMTWSIMYHSWTTFVFLLWALILWLAPSKRAYMMKCSPFVVIYGTILVIICYLYSMDLDNLLPNEIGNVNASEIGFPNANELNSSHLIVKCAFMAIFWITMRQYMNEIKEAKRTSTIRDMAAPFQVSVTAATSNMHQEPLEIKNQFMKDVGRILKKLLIKFWIVVVAIMLFTSGITSGIADDKMTVFRIMYMILFLIFVVSFQISWTAWRKMMYGFWITVIVYSIIMLILVYTYQFKKFPKYWEYIGISEDLQKDIGLETYETKYLFVRLLTPTSFVIIIVLQMHYFHKEFLEITNIDNVVVQTTKKNDNSIQEVSTLDVLLNDGKVPSTFFTLKQLRHMSRLERIALLKRTIQHVKSIYNYAWLIIEIHMQKIIYTSFMLLCVNDVCAINFIFVLAVIVSMNFRKPVQVLATNSMTIAIALLMIGKMLFQIEYLDPKEWAFNCTFPDADNNVTVKNYTITDWIGLKKASKQQKLPDLLKGYIGIIVVTTIRAIILVRQSFYRRRLGMPIETPSIMFPNITRTDADKGIIECLKFFFNYGFYKFGVEFCLSAIVALIGIRLDFYSVIYSIWLLALFAQKRRTATKIWPFFRLFTIIIIAVQYALAVAPPTSLCIDYSWESELKKLRDWLYLPNPDDPPNARKLICDFILLYMIVRQSLVFRVEARNVATNTSYVAGHNYSVYRDMDKPNFVNPVKDYISQIHCWLDIVKRGTMMSFMWIALSMVFLAGTNRTNIFSLGYLIGAFIFLWQGSDFYLRPVKVILKWWNLLIGYTIVVIFCKTIIQGVDSIEIKCNEETTCWIFQLLGFPCSTNICLESAEGNGMIWDGLCFACLIIQKRFFKSYYFFHLVDDTKAMSILASRGAELLEELQRKQIEFRENVEKTVLQKIKLKMDKIKADQKKIHGPSYREPSDHKADVPFPKEWMYNRRKKPKSNRDAIRSGDYYMFDDLHDDDDDDDPTDLFPGSEIEMDEEIYQRQARTRGRRMTVSELMTTLFKTDIEIATHVAMYGGTAKDALRMRRQSLPLTRKKSSMSYLSARSETETAASDDIESTSRRDVSEEAKSSATKKDPSDSDEHLDEIASLEDDEEEAAVDGKEKKEIPFLIYFRFVIEFINSLMISATKYLNRFSRDYRYIRKVLTKEKKILKAKPDFRMGTRLGINQIWQPIPLIKDSSNSPGTSTQSTHIEDDFNEQIDKSSVLMETEEEQQPQLSEADQPPIIQLLASIWFGILAHSTFLCYFMIFLHQIHNASVISTPLPLMVFCWGSLTIPRPSKTFWVTIIAYTEAIIIVKCIFQLEFIKWNDGIVTSNEPLKAPRILGVEKTPNYALWDLLLLLVVFFHRLMLKSLGQWTTSYVKHKISPTKLVIGAGKSSLSSQSNEIDKEKDEPVQLHWENEETGTGSADPSQVDPTSNDDHKIVESDKERLVEIKNVESEICDEKLTVAISMTVQKYSEPLKSFFKCILNDEGKEHTNVYAYMFLCDFFNFLLTIYRFSSFGAQQGDGGVAAYVAENRVPLPFLIMLLVQFAVIVIDRALYLRKSIYGKLIFQYLLIFGVHLWMFFLLPEFTGTRFTVNLPPQIWYMMKCFYLLLSAHQLKLGYPTRILGNFICKNYSIVNYCFFKAFMFVPFLFELRACMDWIWTDTSMTIMDWFKMEDIFANIYQLKCMRGLESDYPQERGVKKAQMSKYLVGGGMLFVIIGLVWFPLLLFALGGTVGDPNPPNEVSLSIRIGAHEPIYTIAAQDSSIIQYSENDFRDLKFIYRYNRTAMTFLENYKAPDVTVVMMSKSSQKLWSITPPDKEKLKQELKSNRTMRMRVEWAVSRRTDVKEFNGISKTPNDIDLPPYLANGTRNPIRETLLDLLSLSYDNSTVNSNSTADDNPTINSNLTVMIKNAFPKFLKVTNQITKDVPQLYDLNYDFPDKNLLLRDIYLQLSMDKDNQEWWSIQEQCNDSFYNSTLGRIPHNNCNYITMILFNDRLFPANLSFISGAGIIGLYTTAIIVVSQIMRRLFSEMAPKIMFEDLPYVDRILRLCLDIYLVRESKELNLEEDLFAKLIFLYRSPETLIKWTRPPEPSNENEDEDEEGGDDDDDNDDVIEESQLSQKDSKKNV